VPEQPGDVVDQHVTLTEEQGGADDRIRQARRADRVFQLGLAAVIGEARRRRIGNAGVDDAADTGMARRVVHTSIANPTASRLSYYRGKAELEDAVRSSGLSYAIVRPTLLFGDGDVLINNIAWLLRHLPVFGIPGDGRYRLQPMQVRDHAALLVQTGLQTSDQIVDSAGPDIFTFEELVHLLRRAMGLHTLVVPMPPALAMVGANVAGRLTGDMLLTRDELDDLMHDILVSHEPPRGRTRLTDWLTSNRDQVGRGYASEIERHYRQAATLRRAVQSGPDRTAPVGGAP